ncbi:MAG TPA: SDR family NAD(P)-dependent oxidoreductase, partial [Halobacteriales archaeon]|nr:SDR family NAD(P)-dependent oxidoreductase [Halobacteriales archaeon]
MDLTDRTVLVTGGSAGIGRAISLAAADAGADVVVVDLERDPRAGSTPTAEAVRERGRDSLFLEADVRDFADLRAAVDAGAELGTLDGVVNNAGVAESYAITETSADNWRRSVQTNLTGVYHGCRAGVEAMLAGDSGAIVNIASGAGVVGLVNSCSYSAAKGGVISLTR